MAALIQSLDKRKRGFWYGRYRCLHFDDEGRIPSVCVRCKTHGDSGKLPLCRCRQARLDAKNDLYLRFIARRAVLGLRSGLLSSAANPQEFDRKDLWPAAVRILKEEFDGNTDIRDMLRERQAQARESVYSPPENPRARGRGYARADTDEGRLLPWLRRLAWPPVEA